MGFYVHKRAYSDVSDRTILGEYCTAYLPFQSSSNLDIRSILKALPAHCRHILLSMYLCIHCKSFYSLAYYYLNFIEPETRINKRPMLLSYVIMQNVNIFEQSWCCQAVGKTTADRYSYLVFKIRMPNTPIRITLESQNVHKQTQTKNIS